MSTKDNKAVVRRFATAFTDHNAAELRQVLAPDLVEGMTKASINNPTWGDHRVEIADMMAEDDKVWALLATSGRHIGPWHGLPATGKTWTNQVAMYCRVANGRIVEMKLIPDDQNMARQLGAVVSVSPL